MCRSVFDVLRGVRHPMNAVRIDRERSLDAVDAQVDRILALGGSVYIDTCTGDLFAVAEGGLQNWEHQTRGQLMQVSAIPSNWKFVSKRK